MKKNLGIILAVALSLSALLLTVAFQAGWVQAKLSEQETRADVAPTIVSYQGQIWDGAEPFDGTGYFKFAIVNDRGDVLWTNDGESPDPGEPVILNVVNGLFSVNLGDTSIGPEMDQPLSASVFGDPLTFLRVWFSETQFGTFTQLPDQPIASVPYALIAESANSAINTSKLGNIAAEGYQLRVSGFCPEGSAVRVVNAAGIVTCEPIPELYTFTRSTIASRGSFGYYLSIATGSDGMGLISYMDNDTKDLWVAHCDNLNCTSAESFLLDEAGDVGYYTSIAIGTDGRGVIAYYDQTNGALKVAKCADAACSYATINTIDNYRNTGYEPAIAVRSDGNPVIVYREGQEEDLKYIRCTDPACSTYSPPVTLVFANQTGYAISMTIGSDGFALITYFDKTIFTLNVIHCNDANCSNPTVSMVENYTSDNPHSNDIAIGTNGFGLISYHNLNSATAKDTLMIVVCENLACSSKLQYTIYEGWINQSADIDMVIGEDGLGLITFFDTINADLMIAHCDNERCTTATTYTMDTPGYMGYFNSISLGSDGLGLIAYYDHDNGDLKVAHCSNAMCIPINYGEN